VTYMMRRRAVHHRAYISTMKRRAFMAIKSTMDFIPELIAGLGIITIMLLIIATTAAMRG